MPTCKLSTKILPATCAWGVLLICTGLFFAFICPFYVYEYTVGIAVYQTILTIFVISNFGFSTFMDPGVYPKASNELVRDGDMPVPLHKTVEINKVTVRMKWCTTCKFYRPPRSSHCSMCDCCIEVFDHHCPWVNNCVGRRNYRFFFQFLVSLSLHIISIFTLCLFFVLKSNEDIKTAPKIISLVLMAIIGILSIPIVGLTCFHVVLIGRGRTTNEQVTGKMRGTKNPFDMGCIRNCCYLFCGPTWPGLLRNNSWMTGSKAVLLSGASYNASDSVVRIYMETSNTSSHRGNKSDYNKMMQMNSREAQEVLHSQKPLLHHHQPTESFEANNLIHAPQGYNRGQQQPHQKPSMTAPIFSYPNGGYPLIHSPIGTNSMAPAPLAVVASAQQSHLLYTQQQQQQQQQQQFHQQQHIQQFQQLNRNHHHHHHHHQYPSMPVETKHHGPDRAGRNKSPAMPLRASSRQASTASVVPSNFHRPEGACLLSCDDRKSSKHHPNSMPHQQRQKQAGYERSQQQAYHSKRSTIDRKDSDITEYKV